MIDKTYDPKAIENKWYAICLEKKLFHSDHTKGGDPYCITIPPPNVTGILHMGHALNITIQDILIRWHRMQGKNVVWMPGTDHAGIATQNVVEKALKKNERKTRQDIGREEFLKKVWLWKDESGSTIINQLKRLGASCDWERERFTMDEGLSDAVTESFLKLYNKGLIYKGNYIINWCPRCHTALSDEESEHTDTRGKLYHIRYKIKDGQLNGQDYIVVATTRPETLLGDTAVAVNPEDERYKSLTGKKLILPVLGRELDVITDSLIDLKFGTGCVKVTPAHDPNDFEMGRRHNLKSINVMNGNGTMNEEAGPYAGMDRFACRKKILVDLEAAGLIEKIEDHQHAVGHCYRCDTVVEPRLSEQWFVKMKPLAEPAIEAVKSGKIRFVPDRWTKVYLGWMENIRDWCISRQIWWGHRIPVFYCDKCRHEWAAKGTQTMCPQCSSNEIRQDEDVLDTWFSSWLWPFSTFGWPETNKDLKFYYPTNELVTASEIIFFWVARMIMSGMEFMGDIPFKTVYIHGTVRDDKGRKMSKSLGNSIDPLTIIDQFSADALRFSLMMITATGQDVFLSNDKFEIGRNFGTKLWNAARFMQMHSEKAIPVRGLDELDPALLSSDDRHIIAVMQKAIADCNDNLAKFRFNDAAHVLYEFVWHQYCDWYLEYAKEPLFGSDQRRKQEVLKVMSFVFGNALKLLQPYMPFVTQELWHEMGYDGEEEFILRASWPQQDTEAVLQRLGVTDAIVNYVNEKHDLVRCCRTLRADYGVTPAKKVDYFIKPETASLTDMLSVDIPYLKSLLRSENITIDQKMAEPPNTPAGICKMGTIYMPVDGLIDVEAEKKRLSGQLAKVQEGLVKIDVKLANENFVKNAPEDVIAQQKARRQEILDDMTRLDKLINTLNQMSA